ncbi:RNA polymerase sigma factor [Lysinibacillus xylanilyticus]|uniref:RNA polymerase sigma factor n=1 Tax=Lysinibacillus xylanilyticus TaxID=582475 RepID=UPI0037FD061B
MEHFSDERVLFQTYYKDVFRACYYMLQNKYDAEDLCQDVFAKALSEDFRAIQNQKSWLLSIAMNMSRNYLKKKNRLLLKENFNFLSSKQFDNTQNIEHTIQVNENKSELVNLMNKLPVRIRKVMVLKYVHDCKDREIAQILKIPEGTVKSRHFKGKKLMEKFIEVDKNWLLEWRGHRE